MRPPSSPRAALPSCIRVFQPLARPGARGGAPTERHFGPLLPHSSTHHCRWVFVPPPGCQYVFRLKSAAYAIPQSYAVSVSDRSSGRVRLLVEDGRVGGGPEEVVAPIDEALVVNFTSLGQGAKIPTRAPPQLRGMHLTHAARGRNIA